MAARASRRRTSTGWRSAASPSTTTMSAACPACRRGATCRPAACPSCIAAGDRSSRSTTPSPRSCTQAGVYSHLVDRPLPLLGGRRRHLSQPLRLLRVRPRPGGRPVEGDGAAALGAAAREYHARQFERASAATSSRRTWSTASSSARSRLPVRAVLRPRPRLPRAATATRRLAAADRDVRSARAVLRAGPLSRRLSDG